MLRLLIEKKCDPNVATPKQRLLPLVALCSRTDAVDVAPCVDLLLAAGADINKTTADGKASLFGTWLFSARALATTGSSARGRQGAMSSCVAI